MHFPKAVNCAQVSLATLFITLYYATKMQLER